MTLFHKGEKCVMPPLEPLAYTFEYTSECDCFVDMPLKRVIKLK